MTRETRNRADRLVRSMATKDVAGAEMILPNTSGDHVRGIKRATPIDDTDLVNKKYVDDNIGGGAVLLNEIGNPSANKTFNMANKGVAFDFTNPTGAGGGFDGAFNIEANGAFTGDLLHIHQHTGNPGAGTHCLHLEASDTDVIPIGITSTHATGIDMGTSKIVALVDPTTDQEAATKKYVDDNDHTQNTDTALGSGAVAADHGTAATDMIINVSYGTGDPPAANTTTIGSLFIKYTA